MTRAEVAEYLSAPRKFAAVATTRADGSPFVTPFGFWFDGESIFVSSAHGRGLAKRLRRDPRVCVTVFDEEPLHAFVTIVGRAEPYDDPGDEISLKIHHRYPKPGIEDQDGYDRAWLSTQRVVFRIPVEEYVSMNQRKVTDQVLLAMSPAEAERLAPGHSTDAFAKKAGGSR